MTNDEAEKIAAEIAAELFYDGFGRRAASLKLCDRGEKSLAVSWGQPAVEALIASRLRAYVERQTGDNPDTDGTDQAHPAWWRGHEYTTSIFCQKVMDILDGCDDGRGVAAEPWESVRRRLLLAYAERKVNT